MGHTAHCKINAVNHSSMPLCELISGDKGGPGTGVFPAITANVDVLYLLDKS